MTTVYSNHDDIDEMMTLLGLEGSKVQLQREVADYGDLMAKVYLLISKIKINNIY